jgi:hypothetical protein
VRPLSVALLAAALATGAASAQRPPARFVHEVPWGGTGTWVAADLHVHTRLSDGAYSVDDVVGRAVSNGCGIVAIADHADQHLRAATPAYREAIEAARAAHPGTIVIPALEWNLPPWNGQEHATVFVPPGPQQWSALADFKRQFDDYHREANERTDAGAALRWLAATADAGVSPVVIYNHPSRVETSKDKHVADLVGWRRVNDVVAGLEGAPGHQGYVPIGAYSAAEPTIDRWDPVVARPGGVWDTLLQRGIDIHAALAGSDFHDVKAGINDRWPCEFAETWLRVPEVAEAGVLRALRAGSFVGVHGHIARDVNIAVSAPGLARPATAGEVIEVEPGTAVTVSVSMLVPDRDWQDAPNAIDRVEFIVVGPSAVSESAVAVAGTGRQRVSKTVMVGEGGIVVRARGRRVGESGPDRLFYTNAIRVTAHPR